MTRWERFFFWLGRINAVGIFLVLLFATFTIATEYYRNYEYSQEVEESKFGNAADDSTPYAADAIETSTGEIAAYFQRDGEELERREGSDITLVDPRTGKTSQVAGAKGAWVVNWELINRPGGVAIGYLARVATEEQYAAGRFDLVVGNFPALQRKVLARNVNALDLPTVSGETSAAFILWTEADKASFVAIDFTDLSISEQRGIPMPAVRKDELSQAAGPARRPGDGAGAAEAPVATFE